MSLKIHPTAKVHPTAVLEGDIEIGEGTEIGPLCYLKGPLVIGKESRICAHCVIGEGPEHRVKPAAGRIRIGDRNVIKELTVIQRGTGERDTEVGSDCFIMDHCHIAHDCLVDRGVTMAPNIVMAGHVKILEEATIGIGVAIHQWSTIGAYAMVGMGAVITKDIPPFCLAAGNPARFSRLNAHAFAKAGIAEGDLAVEEGALRATSEKCGRYFERFGELSRRARLLIAKVD